MGDLGGHVELRDLLLQLSPPARDTLRTVLIRDQSDRDGVSTHLMRYRDGRGNDWADIIECPDPQLGAHGTRFCAEADFPWDEERWTDARTSRRAPRGRRPVVVDASAAMHRLGACIGDRGALEIAKRM